MLGIFSVTTFVTYGATSTSGGLLKSTPYQTRNAIADAQLNTLTNGSWSAILDWIIESVRLKAVETGGAPINNTLYNTYIDNYLGMLDELDNTTRLALGPDYAFLFQYIYPRVYELRKPDTSSLVTFIIESISNLVGSTPTPPTTTSANVPAATPTPPTPAVMTTSSAPPTTPPPPTTTPVKISNFSRVVEYYNCGPKTKDANGKIQGLRQVATYNKSQWTPDARPIGISTYTDAYWRTYEDTNKSTVGYGACSLTCQSPSSGYSTLCWDTKIIQSTEDVTVEIATNTISMNVTKTHVRAGWENITFYGYMTPWNQCAIDYNIVNGGWSLQGFASGAFSNTYLVRQGSYINITCADASNNKKFTFTEDSPIVTNNIQQTPPPAPVVTAVVKTKTQAEVDAIVEWAKAGINLEVNTTKRTTECIDNSFATWYNRIMAQFLALEAQWYTGLRPQVASSLGATVDEVN